MSLNLFYRNASKHLLSGLSIACFTVAAFCTTSFVSAQGIRPPSPPTPNPPDASDVTVPPVEEADIESELLTRGPVHEAYAEQYVDDPQPGLVVSKRPPELIEELPPEEMPEGANVEWIPGYWAWEEDFDDFIWISGLWRDLPVGQRWVPGYWAEVDEGSRWVPGFWTSAETEELTYLPEPPASLEQGPNISAPTDDHFWVPGTWIHQTNNYAWQPGYWSVSYNDYLWMPSRYQWTPRGYIYCSGYWDYPLSRRGVLYSPVHFRNRRVPNRYRGYRYRPRIVVSAGPLLVHLFVRPKYRHYYYGDYYAARYRSRGIYPFTKLNRYSRRGYAYDPLRTYYQASARRTTYNRLVDWNHYFDKHESYRPPRTYRQTQQFFERNRGGNRVVLQQATLGEKLSVLRDRGRSGHRTFRHISLADRNRISRNVSSAVRELTAGRHQFEQVASHKRGKTATPIGKSIQAGINGNRSTKKRDLKREGIVSLKLPEVSQFRDRIRKLTSEQKDRTRADRTDTSRIDGRSIGSSLGSLNRDQRLDQRRENSKRSAKQLTPTDLRERIEFARGKETRTGRKSSSAQRTTGSMNDRLAEIRSRMEAARKQQTGKNPLNLESARDQERGRTSGKRDSGKPTIGSSDLRSRIEAARRDAEMRKNSRGSKGRDIQIKPSERSSKIPASRIEQVNGSERTKPSSSNDLRARIEAARRQAEARRNSQARPATPKPTSRSEKKKGNSATDLRSRIDAARQAAERQHGTERSSKAAERSKARNQPAPKSPTRNATKKTQTQDRARSSSQRPSKSAASDIQSRIDSMRRATDSRQQKSRSSSSAREQRSRSTSTSKKSAPAPTPKVKANSSRRSETKSSIQKTLKNARSNTERSKPSATKAKSAAKPRTSKPAERPSRERAKARSSKKKK